ncbi:hypothetical protein KXW98_003988 [Aspergillus fumigatus]|nr:hypothetical protein CNMCM8714_001531 [Aspergillus fumigatus]KMK61333.1 hypothetical protein Y699_02174 [Aspergillus fumigatus Z5]KAF4268053.1 hypothetical protein CNMCM8812_001982 [Aspergillus fumigatus]KAH1342404.1 hypothetical protein KXX67_006495 [Aspergillus fumigatus]KAH1380370.1 hypothetical protein KXX10_007680 [Aspergillus fumigatus]
MASQSGNAWAQMKAQEQKQQQETANTNFDKVAQQQTTSFDKVAIPRKGPVMGARPITSRKSSGLDYDAELALPMPKPRHLPVEDNGESVEACKSEVMINPTMIKKRSVTEPARPEDVKIKADENSQKEKMKSRVAALRSKLSLKDLAKEFRRDSSKNEPAAGNDGGQISYVDTQDFNEEKLYVPKPREPGVYPLSAPPFPFRDISFGQFSQTSVESCAVASSMANDWQPNNEKLSLGPFAGRNAMQSPVERECERKVQLDTLLLTGSSPAARAGELENSGQAQVIREQPSIRSLRAENDSGSPTSTNISFYAVEDEFAEPISPSIYDNAGAEITPGLPDTAHRRGRVRTNEQRFPVMLATDQPSFPASFNHGHEGVQPTVMTAYQPALEETHDQHFNAQSHAAVAQHPFDGVTSHGGYAPPPPDPDYRNTADLEQQLTSHIEAVHAHMNNVVHRLCRVLENSNNWSKDQILRQTDAMFDILRLINARTAGQNEAVSDLHRGMTNLQCQVGAIEFQMRRMEERLLIGVSSQINKLRGEINASRTSPQKARASCNSAPDPKIAGTEFQAPEITPVVTKDSEKQPDTNEQRCVKKGKMEVSRNQDRKKGKEKEESENVSGGEGSLTQHNNQGPAQNIPSTTVSFRNTPSGEKRREITYSQVKRGVRRNPAQESSGSPEPKAPKLSRQPAANFAPENGQSSVIQDSHLDNNEGVKTPHKKGMFGFRRRDDGESRAGGKFLHTPRRNKKTRDSHGQNGHSSMPSAPAGAVGVSQPSTLAEESPSSIHPALRNDKQKQIMRDRERLEPQPHTQTGQMTCTTERPTPQRRGLKNPHPHQNIGTRAPTSNRLPTNAFVVTPSSSSSLNEDIQLCPPAAAAPPRAPLIRPSYAGQNPPNISSSPQVSDTVSVSASAQTGTQGWQAATWYPAAQSGASHESNQSNHHA